MIKYQILKSNITRTIWQTVRRIANKILGVKGLIEKIPGCRTSVQYYIKNKNKKVTHEVQSSVLLMFLTHFDVVCDQYLNRPTTTGNLLVLFNKEAKKLQW